MRSIARSSQIRSSSCRCSCSPASTEVGEPCQWPSRLLPFRLWAGSGSPSGSSLAEAAPGSPSRPLVRAGRAYSHDPRPVHEACGHYLSAMDGGWLARMRWRRRGAWLWPTFVVVTVARRVIVHALPLLATSQTWPAASSLALVVNVLAVLLLSRPLGALLRRRRPDMPAGVARNYAGTVAVLLVTRGHAGARPRCTTPRSRPTSSGRCATRSSARRPTSATAPRRLPRQRAPPGHLHDRAG